MGGVARRSIHPPAPLAVIVAHAVLVVDRLVLAAAVQQASRLYLWEWDGGPTKIASRAMDSTGYVQPTVAQLDETRELVGFIQHHNGIFPWAINANAEVSNAVA
jgi:hypothetical protein